MNEKKRRSMLEDIAKAFAKEGAVTCGDPNCKTCNGSKKSAEEKLKETELNIFLLKIQFDGLNAARDAEFEAFVDEIKRLQEQLESRDAELAELKIEKSKLEDEYQQKVNVINRLSRDFQRANNEHDQSLGELMQQHKNIVDVLQRRNEKVEAENTRMKDRLLLLTATIGAAMAKIDMIVDAGNYNMECVLQIMDILKRAQLPADDPASTPTHASAKPDDDFDANDPLSAVDTDQPTDDTGISVADQHSNTSDLFFDGDEPLSEKTETTLVDREEPATTEV